jgi:hypothetical protein
MTRARVMCGQNRPHTGIVSNCLGDLRPKPGLTTGARAGNEIAVS